MSRFTKLTASLLVYTGLFPAIAKAGPPSDGEKSAAKGFVPMSDEAAWRRLPPAERGANQPLPSWARVLAGSIPRTTASLLRVEYVHRARNPLDPKLRAEMRWVAAHANCCAYSEEYALVDGRRAGLDDPAIAALRRGDFSGKSPAEKAALEFARKMTVNSASVTDEEFAALVKLYGEKTVAAMVLTMAYANFQDRLVLSLGATIEPGGPLPPLDVVFATGELVTRPPAGAPKIPVPPTTSSATHPSGKDIIPDEPEWTSSSYDELQARLEAQRNKVTRVRVPSWEEVERGLPPGFTTPNRVIWNLVCLGLQPELAAAWETYLRTSAMETADKMDRVFGQSLFWVTTRAVNCPYCMGHCEMGLDLAGMSKPEIARRTRLLAGDDWSSFPPEEQGAYALARKLARTPCEISAEDTHALERDFGPERAIVVLTAACRGHYMTRISNGFQLSLERDNVFREWYFGTSLAAANPSPPATVSLTRPEMKAMLEESKRDLPRLTPPEPTAEELADARGLKNPFIGTRRMRNLLPPELRGGFFFLMDGRTLQMDVRALRNPGAPEPSMAATTSDPSRRIDPDPNMTLDYAFKTMLFWVVSRSNNCVYCMGHNETQLAAFGVAEDRIAALDGDWSQFTLAERAAMELARKLTVAPQTVTDADLDAVRQHFNDRQVLEMIGIVAGFNAMNRWTGPLRLTQEEFRDFRKPTSPRYVSSLTRVGPAPAGSSGSRCMAAAAPRLALEPRSVVEARWAECRDRRPRFALVDESATRALLPAGAFPADRPMPNWVRLLANFPKAGPARVASLRISETKGNLSARLNAQLAWVSARADRSWYALAHARDRLRALGLDDDAIFAIDKEGGSTFTPGERVAFVFARKLTVDPALIGDADFNDLKKYYSDSEIAELIYHVNHDVFFNRLTEAAQLPLEGDPGVSLSRR
jgi:alkylhydroperoxidase family enzyme